LDEALRARIEKVLDEQVRPRLMMDGGNVKLIDVTPDGIARVMLTGGCEGCPMAGLTLTMTVERILVANVPEVKQVEPVDAEASAPAETPQ
jgi:Fe-S cluster biogenesis protein NfuA